MVAYKKLFILLPLFWAFVCVYMLIELKVLNPTKMGPTTNYTLPETNKRQSENTATVVTVWYPMNSKYSPIQYIRWLQNMLELDDPMVVFTTSQEIRRIQSFREKRDTQILIIKRPFLSERMFSTTFWDQQLAIDSERTLHKNTSLYWIWNDKIEFLKQAILLNPFNTTHFVWVDIGCFRDGPYWFRDSGEKKVIMKNYLSSSMHGVSFLNAGPIVGSDFYVGANMYGGKVSALLEWHQLYFHKIKVWGDSGKFIGKDQNMMTELCLEHPDMCHMIKPPEKWHRDRWFFMADIFSGNALDTPQCMGMPKNKFLSKTLVYINLKDLPIQKEDLWSMALKFLANMYHVPLMVFLTADQIGPLTDARRIQAETCWIIIGKGQHKNLTALSLESNKFTFNGAKLLWIDVWKICQRWELQGFPLISVSWLNKNNV